MSTACLGCAKELADRPPSATPAMCGDCVARLGLAPPSPPLRPAKPCARCGHRQILRTQVRLRDLTSRVAYMDAQAITFALGHQFFNPDKPSPVPLLASSVGRYETFACRGCGFTEWYAIGVAKVPIGPEYGTELLEIADDGVYR